MAHFLLYGTHGSDDPTSAVMPFHMAKGVLEAGHTAEVALIGEATYLMKVSIAREVKAVAMPNAAEIIAELVAKGLKISV